MWEEDRNRHGGRWLLQLGHKHKSYTDRYWTELMTMMIGEAFEGESAHICGAIIHVRAKFNKISVWIDCDIKEEASIVPACFPNIMQIGKLIKDRLQLPRRALSYSTHVDTQSKIRYSSKKRYAI
jgi:translation initiation factor 4E